MKKVGYIGLLMAAIVMLVASGVQVKEKRDAALLEMELAAKEALVVEAAEPLVENPTEMQLAVEKVVQVREQATLYMDEQLEQEIATLVADAQLAYIEETAKAYVVAFAKGQAYVKKSAVQQVDPVTWTTLEPASSAKGSIVATEPVTATNSEGEPLLTLLPNKHYPIDYVLESSFAIRVGEQIGYVPAEQVTQSKGIPVLMYHHVLPEAQLGEYKDNSTTVTAEAFKLQMDYLYEEQFQVLTTDELLAYLNGETILPMKSVLLTFDDGLLSTKLYAYPVLKDYDFTAVQHIISARKDREEGYQTFDPTAKLQFFTDEEMAEMADVFTYEAHTFNLHILDPDTQTSRLMKASAGELRDDLRQNIEDLPGTTVFAYPFGQFKEETIEVLKELNFKMAFTTEEGHASAGDDVFQIKRFGPTQQTTIDQFIDYVDAF